MSSLGRPDRPDVFEPLQALCTRDMELARNFPKPQPLDVDRRFSIQRDSVELDLDQLPEELTNGLGLDLVTTHGYDNGSGELDFDVRWSVDRSEYDSTFRVSKPGMLQALAGARELSKDAEAVAVVQVESGERYLVPLGVWTEYDESQLNFADAGGTPYWNGAKDHVLIGRSDDGSADVEAVVFDEGRSWVNLTGHPIRTK